MAFEEDFSQGPLLCVGNVSYCSMSCHLSHTTPQLQHFPDSWRWHVSRVFKLQMAGVREDCRSSVWMFVFNRQPSPSTRSPHNKRVKWIENSFVLYFVLYHPFNSCSTPLNLNWLDILLACYVLKIKNPYQQNFQQYASTKREPVRCAIALVSITLHGTLQILLLSSHTNLTCV